PLPLAQAAYVVKEVCEALDHAHRKCDAQGRPLGIVHRDVSPQNVLVSFEGQVKLIDFGIAKAESRLQKTQAGILKGKFSYMSPEQVKGQPLDGRSDVFACGILLWELVCGEKLFSGESDYAVLDKVRMGLVPPPRSRNPRIPDALERVVLKALATDPEHRYQTASELHDELVRFTVAGDAVFGSRQLASWLREEFKADYDKERKRMRAWLAVGRPPPSPQAPDPAPPTRPDLPPAPLPAVIVSDLAQTPVDPFPAPRRETAELPTVRLEEKALSSAENDRFDLSAERTVAPRKQRASALSRPSGAQTSRRWALYAAMPVAVGLVGVSWVMRTASDRAPAPGKLIVMPSPSVEAADLVIDGRPSGQLPPFVHTLAAGKHQIEVRAAGYKPFSANVEVKPGAQPLELTAHLEADAPLRLEEVALAQPPAEAPQPPVHRRAAGSRPPAAPKPVAAASPVAPLSIPPPDPAPAESPAVGYLVVKTTPSMRLTVDGRDLDRWTPVPPANPVSLPAGPHTLLLESADGRRLEERVQIEAGQTARLVRSLP
ncbi:MAG: protein kinase domain-containing protein, partial [Myxococcales bacterium]